MHTETGLAANPCTQILSRFSFAYIRVQPRAFGLLMLALMVVSTACMVGPKYKRPAAAMSPAYKEQLPQGWKEAQPNDAAIRGKWWEIYNDPQLNALEEKLMIFPPPFGAII